MTVIVDRSQRCQSPTAPLRLDVGVRRKNPPLKGSYIARMCEKLDIDPTAALEE